MDCSLTRLAAIPHLIMGVQNKERWVVMASQYLGSKDSIQSEVTQGAPNVPSEIRRILAAVASGNWMKIFLNNLDFNGRENLHLTDDDACIQGLTWKKEATRILSLDLDVWTRSALVKTLDLLPKIETEMFGCVAEENWSDFC